MGTNLMECDGASVTRFAGGSSNFQSYRGAAYQLEDERGRYIALTPVQALRLTAAIVQDQNPNIAKLDEDDKTAPALPNPVDGAEGMFLRDYFAAKFIDSCRAITGNVDEAARAAYQFADAMLVARKAAARG